MSWSRSVFSRMVSEIGYDSNTGELLVTWASSGRISAYAGVSEDMADQISRAPSVGDAINGQIKGAFSHRYVG